MAAVFQHESGIPGNYPGKAKRGFAKLATSGTQLEFPQFEKVGEENKVVTKHLKSNRKVICYVRLVTEYVW